MVDSRQQIHAELRSIHSPDLIDMQATVPKDPEQFSILVQALIGPKGLIGTESFDFTVCTPKWLSSELSKRKFMFGRQLLIVDCYSYDVVWTAISALCQRSWGESWDEVVKKLARYGAWEFEDYVPYSG